MLGSTLADLTALPIRPIECLGCVPSRTTSLTHATDAGPAIFGSALGTETILDIESMDVRRSDDDDAGDRFDRFHQAMIGKLDPNPIRLESPKQVALPGEIPPTIPRTIA